MKQFNIQALLQKGAMLLLFLSSFFTHTNAQSLPDSFKPLWGQIGNEYRSLQYYPSLSLGTHVNRIGLQLAPSITKKFDDAHQLQLKLTSSLRFHLSNLGISGTSINTVNKLALRYSFGKKRSNFQPYFASAAPLAHHLEFHYLHYGTTDGTSQFSGGFSYTAIKENSLIQLTMENDVFAFLGLDEFRTAAFAVDYKKLVNNKLYGIGLGTTLWTGTTKGLANLERGQEYNMTNQYGSAYTHGLLFVNLHYQGLTFSIGYDADGIRRVVQDSVHYLINDGNIPRGTEQTNGIFFQIKLFDFDTLY